ncbi:hypothetical protein NQ317_014610 [Molorchus minor]|uniref:Uncharacterized protein n=1 Tax=Molorchus minor TaxID=1323400 RepID=A0ABQ9JM16_9CUCU|nr:hypothetical protein NQ317_014610 [Molorchus minor]
MSLTPCICYYPVASKHMIPCRRPVKRQTFNWNIQPLDICLYCLWSFYHQYFPKKVSKITYTIRYRLRNKFS